jgi:hypothetical protein
MIINVQLASLIYCSNIYALGIGIQSSSERLLLHELTESLNSFSVQFLNQCYFNFEMYFNFNCNFNN